MDTPDEEDEEEPTAAGGELTADDDVAPAVDDEEEEAFTFSCSLRMLATVLAARPEYEEEEAEPPDAPCWDGEEDEGDGERAASCWLIRASLEGGAWSWGPPPPDDEEESLWLKEGSPEWAGELDDMVS